MPAYIRLLAYFSNFILLAAFLGIGVGCLMTRTRSLFAWYAPLQALVIGVVAYFRLEVAVPTSSSLPIVWARVANSTATTTNTSGSSMVLSTTTTGPVVPLEK